MKFIYYLIILLLFVQSTFLCQGFNISKSGTQTFYFKDPENRNQISFTSETYLETFEGIATDVWGEISFDPTNIQDSIKGEIFISINSFKTGIDERDENLRGSNWLNSQKYPNISFKIQDINQLTELGNNKIKLLIDGLFTCHGKSKEIKVNATLTLQEESALTKKRIPGDLLSVVAKFDINLSDYGIKNVSIPQRVSDKQEITVNIVGTNLKPE
jgi:polyisoprenoid-binding protein YceI